MTTIEGVSPSAWRPIERQAFVNESANEVVEILARGHKRDLKRSMTRGAVTMVEVRGLEASTESTEQGMIDSRQSGEGAQLETIERIGSDAECRHDRKSAFPRNGGRLSGDGSPAGEPPEVLHTNGRPSGDGSLAGEPMLQTLERQRDFPTIVPFSETAGRGSSASGTKNSWKN